MVCRCKYSTSLILILIISTPDVSCKHFISHGLSVEPLVLLVVLTNASPWRRLSRGNLTLQRRSPMKLLLLFGFWALLSSSGFVYLRIFLSKSKQVLCICKNFNLEDIFKAETCRSPCQAHATRAPHTRAHTHTRTHSSWLGAGSPHLAHRWHAACHHVPPRDFMLVPALQSLEIYDRFEELKFVWRYRNGEENENLPLCFSCIGKTPSVFRIFNFFFFLENWG